MIIINDLHIGAKRVAGTTPESAARLRFFLQDCFESVLKSADDDIAVNGDLFDTHQVPLSDLLVSYSAIADWLRSSGRRIYLLAGNHDLSKSSIELSSFEMMARLLIPLFPEQVVYMQGGGWVDEAQGIYAVTHVVNQAEFDLQLERVPAEAKALLLHCNYDSPFAEHADHSLNLTREVAKQLVERGVQIVIGHEHHPSSFFGGKVLIPGNQFPASVADCVTPEGRVICEKHCLRINADGYGEKVRTWQHTDDTGFVNIPWGQLEGQTLRDAEDFQGFIRVSGTAEPEEVAEALKRISRLRQKSQALVVANAVRAITRDSGVEEIAESIDDVRKVDVVQLVLDTLTPAQAQVVRAVLEKN